MDAQVSALQAQAGAPAPARARIPGPETILRTVAWMVRDRGTAGPHDLHGVSRLELETTAMLRKFKPATAYASFDESLAAAIEHGWIATYRCGGRVRYYPNLARGADPDGAE